MKTRINGFLEAKIPSFGEKDLFVCVGFKDLGRCPVFAD